MQHLPRRTAGVQNARSDCRWKVVRYIVDAAITAAASASAATAATIVVAMRAATTATTATAVNRCLPLTPVNVKPLHQRRL